MCVKTFTVLCGPFSVPKGSTVSLDLTVLKAECANLQEVRILQTVPFCYDVTVLGIIFMLPVCTHPQHDCTANLCEIKSAMDRSQYKPVAESLLYEITNTFFFQV